MYKPLYCSIKILQCSVLRCMVIYRHRIRIMLAGDLWETVEMKCELYKSLSGEIQGMEGCFRDRNLCEVTGESHGVVSAGKE